MGESEESDLTQPAQIQPFVEPLAAVCRVLQAVNEEAMLMGGIAASLIGKPRLTADIDLLMMLEPEELEDLIRLAGREGIQPRFDDTTQFARQSRMLLLVHTQSGIHIDIALGMLPFETEAMARSALRKMGSLSVRLPTPEDLIIQKAVAGRPKDMEDIRGIVAAHPNLDTERIYFWVTQFAESLEMPDMIDNLRSVMEGG